MGRLLLIARAAGAGPWRRPCSKCAGAADGDWWATGVQGQLALSLVDLDVPKCVLSPAFKGLGQARAQARAQAG